MTGLRHLHAELARLPGPSYWGQVAACVGTTLEVVGLESLLSPGDKCEVVCQDGRRVLCEVVGFHAGRSVVMPFESVDGVVLGSRVRWNASESVVRPHDSWLGRVVDATAEPIDGLGPLLQGDARRRLRDTPPPACSRRRLGGKLETGLRALNSFVPICRGQRMGVFAGSGVGKSTLLSMLVRASQADVNVIGLVGERGREVQEFLENSLGPEGLQRSVLVVATSDESPQMRRQAAYTTLAIAEHFRDRGQQVLCLIDSVTRFAMAQREIGLAAGEPPTAKGYPPSVFAELARLLERAGPGAGGQGDITGVFSVLVEGDDTNEPVADSVRGILDGHLVLDRQIAERGRYPAIDVLRSVSRALPACHEPAQLALLAEARKLLAAYGDMQELIRIGAYRQGGDPLVDRAIAVNDALESFLAQPAEERSGIDDTFARLAALLDAETVAEEAPAPAEVTQPEAAAAPRSAEPAAPDPSAAEPVVPEPVVPAPVVAEPRAEILDPLPVDAEPLVESAPAGTKVVPLHPRPAEPAERVARVANG